MTPTDRLSLAIRLHKQARGFAPTLEACALIAETIAHVERHHVPAESVEPLVLAALLEGGALAKAAGRLGCAFGSISDVTVALFARPIIHDLVEDLLDRAHAETSPPRETIHILHEGRAICGAGAPRDWPTDKDGRTSHRWLGIEDAQHSTCPDCLLRAADIIEARARVPVTTEAEVLAEVPCAQWWHEDADGKLFRTDAPPSEPMGLPPSMDAPDFRCVVTPIVEETPTRHQAEVQEEVYQRTLDARAAIPDLADAPDAIVRLFVTLDTGESPETDGALGRALDLLAEDVAAEERGDPTIAKWWENNRAEPTPFDGTASPEDVIEVLNQLAREPHVPRDPPIRGNLDDLIRGLNEATPKPLRRPRCASFYYAPGEGQTPCARPLDHRGDCGPAKPRKAGA